MAAESAFALDHHVRHDAICDGCNKTIFGIRHQCRICPDWNYCNVCVANAPLKHALHQFAAVSDPQRAGNTATVRSQALDFGRLETRFLTIAATPFSPGSSTNAITSVSCGLAIHSLYECPEYIALSYSWGDHGSTRPILLDGRITQVTTSLEMALKELVARGIRVIWVDALCIDQENAYEKVYQLRQMGTIFSRAAKVIAWLGPAAEDSDNAMQALETMCESDDVDMNGPALVRLLERQYWERVWIIQELAKASSVEVWCGTQVIPWDTFIEGIQTWWSTSKFYTNDIALPIITLKFFCDAERNSRRGATRMLLSTAMVRTLHTKATLWRDRAYALLGITHDGTETIATPNYTQTDAQVFESIFRHMIVQQGQLDLIFLACLRQDKGPTPSWLPTWDSEMPLQVSPWLARCFKDPQRTESAVACQDGMLKLRGHILGRLQTRETDSEQAHSTPNFLDAFGILYSVIAQVFKCGGFGQKVDCISSRNPFTLASALAAFWRSPAEEDRVKCPNLRQWLEDHVDTLYTGYSLRSVMLKLRGTGDIVESRYRGAGAAHVFSEDDFPELWPWLGRLEASVSTMIRHDVKLATICVEGQSQLVTVPRSARQNDLVVRITDVSLPVVLRDTGGFGRMIGEVVEDPGWDVLYMRKDGQENRKRLSLSRPPLDGLEHCKRWTGFHRTEDDLYIA